MASSSGRMVSATKVNLLMTNVKAKESSFGQMVVNILASGNRANNTELEII